VKKIYKDMEKQEILEYLKDHFQELLDKMFTEGYTIVHTTFTYQLEFVKHVNERKERCSLVIIIESGKLEIWTECLSKKDSYELLEVKLPGDPWSSATYLKEVHFK
jgi:hypothetical protein